MKYIEKSGNEALTSHIKKIAVPTSTPSGLATSANVDKTFSVIKGSKVAVMAGLMAVGGLSASLTAAVIVPASMATTAVLSTALLPSSQAVAQVTTDANPDPDEDGIYNSTGRSVSIDFAPENGLMVGFGMPQIAGSPSVDIVQTFTSDVDGVIEELEMHISCTPMKALNVVPGYIEIPRVSAMIRGYELDGDNLTLSNDFYGIALADPGYQRVTDPTQAIRFKMGRTQTPVKRGQNLALWVYSDSHQCQWKEAAKPESPHAVFQKQYGVDGASWVKEDVENLGAAGLAFKLITKADVADNCPTVYNPYQLDTSTDDNTEDGVKVGHGDVCDPDMNRDSDEIPDFRDNCLNTPNPDQLDTNNDGIGDKCDIDGDGISIDSRFSIVAAEFSLDDKDTVAVDFDGSYYTIRHDNKIPNPDWRRLGQTFTSKIAGIVEKIELPMHSCVGYSDGWLKIDMLAYRSNGNSLTVGEWKDWRRFYKPEIDTVPTGKPISFDMRRKNRTIQAGEKLFIVTEASSMSCRWNGVLSAVDDASNTAYKYSSFRSGYQYAPLNQVSSFGYKVWVQPVVDNCPTVANPDQANRDHFHEGDACQDTDGDGNLDIIDTDDDDDGIADSVDSCPLISNGLCTADASKGR